MVSVRVRQGVNALFFHSCHMYGNRRRIAHTSDLFFFQLSLYCSLKMENMFIKWVSFLFLICFVTAHLIGIDM